MAQRGAGNLLKNASATGAWTPWTGGRSSLVLMGTFPTTLKLQILGQDGSTAVDVATLTVNGKTDYDLPAGSYRIFISGGSPSGLYADLVTIPYT